MIKRGKSERWAYLCRAGSEKEVAEELGDDVNPEIPADGLVVARRRAEPVFARQAMRVHRSCATGIPAIAGALAEAIAAVFPADRAWPWTIQVVAPDSNDPRDPRRAIAAAIDAEIATALDARLARRVADAYVAEEDADRIAQVWIIDKARALVGFTATGDALTVVAGGREKIELDAPSRSAAKLEEALRWIGVAPERGQLVVDLGAAPGGWTAIASRRGAKVIAVDRQDLSPDVDKRRVRHVVANAFEYAPDESADWLLCDLAHRPNEVASLVAKWARHGWAHQAIVSFKLPMKQKSETLRKLIATLEDAGWTGTRARQLFHDKDEVTVFAYLEPKLAARGYRPTFAAQKQARDEAAKAKRRGRTKQTQGPRKKR